MKYHGIAFTIVGLLAGCGGNSSSPEHKTASQSKQSANTVQAVQASDYQNAVQQLYIAYFGRPADPGGLANFQAALLAAGAHTDIPGLNADYSSKPAVKTLVDGFGTSDESIALYGNSSNTAFISAIYQNVLGRTPPANDEGLAYWVGAVTTGGLSRGNAALAITAGGLSNPTAQGKLDALLINNRLTVAAYFTSQLSAQNAVGTYAGDSAAASARAMLAAVSASTNTTTYAQTSAMASVWPDVVKPGLYQGLTKLTVNSLGSHSGWTGQGSMQVFVMPDGYSYLMYGTTTSNADMNSGIFGVVTGGGAFEPSGIAVGVIAATSDTVNYGYMTQFGAPGNQAVAAQASALSFAVSKGEVPHWVGYYGNLPAPGVKFYDSAYQGKASYSVYAAGKSSYTYDKPATLASIAFTWSGKLLDGATASIAIAADGALSGTSSLGCALTGTARASASGKNFYDVSITYGPAPCAAPNQTETGIAYNYALSDGSAMTTIVDKGTQVNYPALNGKSEIVIATTNSAKTHTTTYTAWR